MNTEELKQRFAKECAVNELDTREADAVEWTVAAMSKSNETIDDEERLCWAAVASGVRRDDIPFLMKNYKITKRNEAGERK